MKGRAHRLQSADPHEDWVDGSWTVDCVCGVNFDDGEEMVNCDECGVWVHTRCSRYTKGDELFACDKCKNKGNRNDSAETEVAQLLVELPTKTVKLESSFAAHGPPRRPFRLWTQIPMEERVHVQGAPGGDPSLYGGLSGVFTPELWKCTGYVPKKFNFQYREFPSWDDEKERDAKNNKQSENDVRNMVDNGAGVLFSLSKERVLDAPVYRRKEISKELKNREGEDEDINRSRKDRNLLRPAAVHSSKRKKDDLGVPKERSGKKKVRTLAQKESDEKKRAAQSYKTVFRPTSDGKQLEFYEDRGSKTFKTDVQSLKNKDLKDHVLQELMQDGKAALNNGVEKPRNNEFGNARTSEASPSEVIGHAFSIRVEQEEDKIGHQFPAAIESSPKAEDVAAPVPECKDAGSAPVNEEGQNARIDKLDDSVECYAQSGQEHLIEDMASAAPEGKGNQILQDSNCHLSQSSVQPDIKVKAEVNIDNCKGASNVQSSSSTDAKEGVSHNMSVTTKTNDAGGSSLHSQVVDRTSEAAGDHHNNKANDLSSDPLQHKLDLEGPKSSESAQKSFPESKHVSGFAEEPSNLSPNFLNSQAPSSQHKMVACVGNLSSTTSAADNSKPADTENSSLNTKLKVMSDGGASIKKDHTVREVDRHDLSQKMVEDHTKTSVTSTSKASHQSRFPSCSASKRTIPESKDSVPSSSSKVSSMQNTSGSAESSALLQNQTASHVQQNKSNSQSNYKVNHGSAIHLPPPSNSPATLSDEELALLLHQELNSSPRVPRVPRVRHTGSFPQLASPTATSMLIKRTSSSGGKDHGSFSRRKNKDVSRDGSRGSRELDYTARKVEKVSSSPDMRKQDAGYSADASTRKEDKKNLPPAPTMTTSSGPSSSMEANDQNLSSFRNSPRNISDDDAGTGRGPVPRTLPGLINEIMSKGRRMTYEELCDAVLPHWPYLRKHNGERYAYSSHSQAVLDCLRNRHEWAQLVDRGPKTNSSRKRRKVDTEESEDNEYSRGRTTKEVDTEGKSLESQREDFPKGKRKARKRRRLALQGRGIKDVRRRRKADFTDDDTGPFSNSSEDSMFSEDEIQGDGACPGGSEASSSDEMGTL